MSKSRTYEPKSLYLDDDSDHFDHGAAVLLLVRNNVATTWKQLRAVYRYDRDRRPFHSDDMVLRDSIRALIAANMLESDNSYFGPLRVTENAYKVLGALEVSLTQLANMPPTSGVAARPVFGKPTKMHRCAHVFVLMPFAVALRRVYAGPIRRACHQLKLSVERADDIFSAAEIMDDVWASIANALVIVADCTGRNANVFYELGMAHTFGKHVILLAQDDSDVPSDIRHYRYIKYRPSAAKDLEIKLTRTLRNVVAKVRTA